VFQKREKERVLEIDFLNFLLGKYVGFGVNDPKKYPRKPFLEKKASEEPREMSSEDMERMARANTLKLGGDIQ
jgi:hypothetical protein